MQSMCKNFIKKYLKFFISTKRKLRFRVDLRKLKFIKKLKFLNNCKLFSISFSANNQKFFDKHLSLKLYKFVKEDYNKN